MNNLIGIGFLSGRVCYINRPLKECMIDYVKTQYPFYDNENKKYNLDEMSEEELINLITVKGDLEITEYEFDDKFGAYDIQHVSDGNRITTKDKMNTLRSFRK